MKHIVSIVLLTVLASARNVAGACIHIANDDMLEYSCTGGNPLDLTSIPDGTEKIRITKMSIPVITTDTFSRFGSNLWVLICTYCDIVDIEPTAFQTLVNLQHLSLSNNHLSIVKEAWFKGLDYLTYLDLNYNEIREIEDGVYKNLPSLVDFRISGNRLRCLNTNAMSNVHELKRIFINENPNFKCPNAVGRYLEERGVTFEKDTSWADIVNDLVEIPPMESSDSSWRTISTTWQTTPFYHTLPNLPTDASRQPWPEEYTTPIYVPPVRVSTSEEAMNYPSLRPSTYDHTEKSTTPSWPPRNAYYPPYPYASYSTTTTPTTTRQSIMNTYVPSTVESRGWSYVTDPAETAAPEYSPYPTRENGNAYYDRSRYQNEISGSVSLATSPTIQPDSASSDRSSAFEASPTEESSNFYRTPIVPDRSYHSEMTTYYPDPVDEKVEPILEEPSKEDDMTHVIRPIVPPPEIVQPAAPGDFLQVPYYEPTVTIRPPSQNYQQRTSTDDGNLPMETTTTDKPLPECPKNSSKRTVYSSQLVLLASVVAIFGSARLEF